MKNAFATALIAAAAFTAVPAMAQQVAPGADAAIAHFNESRDINNKITVNGGETGAELSTRSGTLAEVYAQFNQSAETANDLIGTQGAADFSGTPAFGAEIFDQLAAE